MRLPMFTSGNLKPSEHAPTLRGLLNVNLRDIHFTATDHRITPVHDIVFLDEVGPKVVPLIYRPMPSTPPASSATITLPTITTTATTPTNAVATTKAIKESHQNGES